MNVYVTGDIHGNFKRLKKICNGYKTNKNDVIVILGDVGLNYFLDERDIKGKEFLSSLDATFFCIQGNHEKPARNLPQYKIELYANGRVYVEPEYPNILFPVDGDIFCLGGYKCTVLGGAYSVDKYYRLSMGYKWFEDEQLSTEEQEDINNKLLNKEVDFVFSHTCPTSCEPTECYLSFIDQREVDKTTELWLEKIKDSFTWRHWLCGHFHQDMVLAPYMEMLYTDFIGIDEIEKIWSEYKETLELPYYYKTSNHFKEITNGNIR